MLCLCDYTGCFMPHLCDDIQTVLHYIDVMTQILYYATFM